MDHMHHDMGHENMSHDHHDHMHATEPPAGHNHHMDHSMMMMHMTFHFGYSEKILFDFWDVKSVTGFISSLIGIFVISLIYEGIKYYREYLFWENLNSIHYKSVTNGQVRNSIPENIEPVSRPKIWSWFNAMQTGLHILQMTISYMLMLIFMTFNVWLCAAVVLGSATGYFFFGWKKTLVVDRNEHCH